MTPGTHWLVVREVISSTTSGAQVMSALPGLVRRLLDEEAWQEFTAPGHQEPVRHETFSDFIRDVPPKGLGGRADQLIALCGTDESTAERVRLLLLAEIPEAGPAGRPSKTNLRDTKVKESDTTCYVVARLKRDDPDLAERVVRGEVSPNAAARSKGWRKPRIVVSSPERTAESLRKHMPLEARQALARLLLEEEH